MMPFALCPNFLVKSVKNPNVGTMNYIVKGPGKDIGTILILPAKIPEGDFGLIFE
jgi:hypothetical protein